MWKYINDRSKHMRYSKYIRIFFQRMYLSTYMLSEYICNRSKRRSKWQQLGCFCSIHFILHIYSYCISRYFIKQFMGLSTYSKSVCDPNLNNLSPRFLRLLFIPKKRLSKIVKGTYRWVQVRI